jgi:hypothetical protein
VAAHLQVNTQPDVDHCGVCERVCLTYANYARTLCALATAAAGSHWQAALMDVSPTSAVSLYHLLAAMLRCTAAAPATAAACFTCLPVDLQTDPNNCVECSKQCAVSVQNVNGVTCSAGKCDYTQCSYYYGDCNGNGTDGCEVGNTAAADQQQQQGHRSACKHVPQQRQHRASKMHRE